LETTEFSSTENNLFKVAAGKDFEFEFETNNTNEVVKAWVLTYRQALPGFKIENNFKMNIPSQK